MFNARLTSCLHVSYLQAFLFNSYFPLLDHSFISSSHSLHGLPLVVFPSIPQTPPPSPVCYLPFYRSMCPNKFNFLCLIRCMIFLLLPTLFLISSFVICRYHLTFSVLKTGADCSQICIDAAMQFFHHSASFASFTACFQINLTVPSFVIFCCSI